ncbi:MAG: pyridoxal-phosphate dependent enzyme, partial [Anaerolineales bacterium]|nr:pyridoxal-phosphate dependent enzyme [Anaerolineales bacterium]
MIPTLHDIRQAAQRIRPYAHRTPVLTNESLNQLVGAQVFLKCENLQKAGAFKFRGACNAVYSLSDEEAARGVCTHSSGNHAQALALAARIRGIPVYIVMPNNAPSV